MQLDLTTSSEDLCVVSRFLILSLIFLSSFCHPVPVLICGFL